MNDGSGCHFKISISIIFCYLRFAAVKPMPPPIILPQKLSLADFALIGHLVFMPQPPMAFGIGSTPREFYHSCRSEETSWKYIHKNSIFFIIKFLFFDHVTHFPAGSGSQSRAKNTCAHLHIYSKKYSHVSFWFALNFMTPPIILPQKLSLAAFALIGHLVLMPKPMAFGIGSTPREFYY